MLKALGEEGEDSAVVESCMAGGSSRNALKSCCAWGGVQLRAGDSEETWRVQSRRNRYATMQK
jgi:hypothetical protein